MRLAIAPELGDMILGTGRFRKLRWADPRRGKGRRGGLRVIYYFFPSEQQIWLMTLYDKNETSDLTLKEKQALKSAIETELRARQARSSQSRGNRGGKGDEKEKIFRRNDGRRRGDENPSRGQNHAAHLQR